MANKDQPRWRKAVSTGALIVLLIILALEIILFPKPSLPWRHDLLRAVVQIERGVRFYEVEYGTLPPANDNAGLIKALTGDNPRSIKFEVFDPTQLNAEGELLDPWGTPFQVSIDAEPRIHINSAGPDRRFGTKDDIRFDDSVRNNLP